MLFWGKRGSSQEEDSFESVPDRRIRSSPEKPSPQPKSFFPSDALHKPCSPYWGIRNREVPHWRRRQREGSSCSGSLDVILPVLTNPLRPRHCRPPPAFQERY